MSLNRRKIVSEYVRHRLTEETRDRGRAADLSRRAKLSGAHISNVVSGKAGAGGTMVDKLATYWGMSYVEMNEAAEAWHAQQAKRPLAIARTIEREERYPNRGIARDFAIAAGVSAEAIADVDSMVLDSEEDPNPRTWLRWYDAANDRLRYARAGAGTDGDEKAKADTRAAVSRTKPKLPTRR